MRTWIVPALLLLPLVGCADSPKTISQNPKNVAIQFETKSDLEKRVAAQAAAQCAEYGKIAILQNVSQVGDGGVANFDCVEKNGPTRRLSPSGTSG